MSENNTIKLIFFKEETTKSGAEGATTPETLRQKDLKHINSGKKTGSHRRSKSLR